MAEVKIQEGESIESALRRFKRKVQQEDIIKDIKKHSFYLKPGDKRRAKQALARKRNRNSGASWSNRRSSEPDEVATDGVPRPDPQLRGLRDGVHLDGRRAAILRRQELQKRTEAVQGLQSEASQPPGRCPCRAGAGRNLDHVLGVWEGDDGTL